ncbi:succinate dehydrogenase/fumarate reductase flavoprotein subunit [Plasticicumulans lactativorans]|uniref:Succinate dehydrogenase/fumarate reductase flavoprotein subunit n=1 Tax=Plasticicumulans lactativorans TaxID=1133106 RepID=A0A4R2L924_9GAMM|nr:FAD-dependent oxidoreductase [Plasticicumulans lactativorans]TCO79238.1 succinate dehydrogenase/fumarate reductase flavoprotein subunit [Plasticicumulans lactativorans]
MTSPITCDLLVVGSGAGGLSAAVTAAALGLKVLVVEKEPVYGGTTAWSGGWLWIPRNPLAVAAGIREDLDGPRTYLRHELGAHYDAARVEAFLEHGPRMVAFFQAQTAVEFIDGNAIPDFHGHAPGAREGGRSVCAAPFDARELGPRLAGLRPPLDLIAPWGMGIASGVDLRHFLNAMRAWASFHYVAKRVATHVRDLLLHRRGMHLVNGNALVARLARSAFDRGVELWLSSPVERLLHGGHGVRGAVVATPQGPVEVHARHGVVLACGGFPHDAARQRALFPHAADGAGHWSAAPSSNTGDGLRLGESAGGEVAGELAGAAGWAPVSLVHRRDGSVGHFPHLIERAKPGLIAVTRRGARFVNEAGSYYDFMNALFAVTPPGEPVEAWLVCDHRFIRRYGLGHVRPAPLPLGPSLRSGYLRRGRSIDALAAACGIDAAGLRATLDAYNGAARDGRDPAFGRGSTPYERVQGDPTQAPNPCVAPIEHGPCYAVKVVPGSLGTFAGLRTDAAARVLDRAGAAIPGLYAVGNDMASVMGGCYPSGGITLGPAMTFGYIAAHHAAGVPLPGDAPVA